MLGTEKERKTLRESRKKAERCGWNCMSLVRMMIGYLQLAWPCCHYSKSPLAVMTTRLRHAKLPNRCPQRPAATDPRALVKVLP